MTKTTWVFPGQGSQAVGMGVDLGEIPSAQLKLERAEQVLGWSVLDMCKASEEQLSRTLYTQPCLYVIESILADLLLDQGQTPQFVAGHSLGEYSALYAARVFEFDAGLYLVKHRAELMDSAAGGKMVALIRFNRQQLESIIQDTPNVVIANDNSEQQVVISGTPDAVDSVIDQIKVRRVIPVKVSGAFHSPMMANAAEQFQDILSSVPFMEAAVPVLSNVDPTPSVNGEVLKERLLRQMTGSVRWRDIMAELTNLGIEKAIEVGPGKVLSGLLRRECSGVVLENVGSLQDCQ